MGLLMVMLLLMMMMIRYWCEATHESEAALKSVMGLNRIRSALAGKEERGVNVVNGCYLLLQRTDHPSIRFKLPPFASEQGEPIPGHELLRFLAECEFHMNGDDHALYMKDVEVRAEEIMNADNEVGMYETLSLAHGHDGNILQVIHTWEHGGAPPGSHDDGAIMYWWLKEQKPCRVAKVLRSTTEMVPILLPKHPYLKWENAFIELTLEDEEVWKKAALKSVLSLHRMTAALDELKGTHEKLEGCYLLLQREGHPSIRLKWAQHAGVEASSLAVFLDDLDYSMHGAYATYMKQVAVTQEEMKEALDEVCMYDKLSLANEHDHNITRVIGSWTAAPHKQNRDTVTLWYMKKKLPILQIKAVTRSKKVSIILLPKYPYVKWGNDYIEFTLV